MRIGELSEATGCPVETIRYYEKEGLLAEPSRNQANYRLYRQVHLEQLQFIRHCRALDMNLDEIRQLLSLRARPSENCLEIDRLIEAHIGHVRERIAVLQSLEAQLQALRDNCSNQSSVDECGILQKLESGKPAEQQAAHSHLPWSHGH